MEVALDSTIRHFRRGQLANHERILGAMQFATALTEPAPRSPSNWGALLELFLVPLTGAVGDTQRAKNALLLSYVLLTATRGAGWAVEYFGNDPSVFDSLGVACDVAASVSTKALFSHFSQNPDEFLNVSIRTAILSAAGAMAAPIFQGVVLRSPVSPRLVSATAAAICAIVALVACDDTPRAPDDAQPPTLAYTPFNLSRLASSSKDASLALAASFLARCASSAAMMPLLEQIVASSTPQASPRLRFQILSVLVLLGGQWASRTVQSKGGIAESALLASAASAGMSLAILAKRPHAALLLAFLSQRASDASDCYLAFERDDGGGYGETWSAISNLQALASIVGSLMVNFANARAGPAGVVAFIVACSASSEGLRRTLQTKLLSIQE